MARDSIERTTEVLRDHVACERRGDVDGTMASVAANPVYELHPLYILRGRTAVREMYSRLLPTATGESSSGSFDDESVSRIGPGFCVLEGARVTEQTSEASRRTAHVVVAYVDDGLVSAERAYFTDPVAIASLNERLGHDFDTVPGVSRIP